MSVKTSTSSPLTTAHTPTRTPRSTTTPSGRPSLAGALSFTMQPLLSPKQIREQSPTSKRRSPSPNYFGFSTTSASHLPVSTYNGQHHTRQNWSPPSSAVRSTAAASPSVIPLDQNPDFAAFRRQSEGLSFNLGNLHTFSSPVQPERAARDIKNTPTKISLDTTFRSPPAKATQGLFDADASNLGRSPKRHLSTDSTTTPPDFLRKQSPAVRGSTENVFPTSELSTSPQDIRGPPLPANIPALGSLNPRAETAPLSNGAPSPAEQALVTPQHIVTLMDADPESILLLDLRVSTQYQKSRIMGALNLCIPTTLIKRPSFNVTKLAETFKSNEQRVRFEKWKNSKYIVVYDAAASQAKDVAICLNTIKKFDSEGYEGTALIIKGGFTEFAKAFPGRIDKKSDVPSGAATKMTLRGEHEAIPVIGGCPMPATQNAANPFFGNIRQNMDLIGGVGQIAVNLPSGMPNSTWQELPRWLRKAADDINNGKEISDKFLSIEKGEQRRMQDALSGTVSYGNSDKSATDNTADVQIAGIEKGSKNRYNNIWPFEHSRVKLEDIPDDGCDYLNASHISFPLTNKRYIATQCPIPATFADFWNAVWQQDVRVIVMLTAEKEGAQVKAHDYWSGKNYGPFRLEQLSERRATVDPDKISRHRTRQSTDCHRPSMESKPSMSRNDSTRVTSSEEPFITVRKLTLSHENFPFEPIREITHMQCTSWPDFGAPAHPAHLLGLVEQCNAVSRSGTTIKYNDPEPANSRQVLVHCSAGCGRTGTFCTVDSVIDMLKRQRRAPKRKREGTPMDVDGTAGFAPSPKKKPSLERGASDPFFVAPQKNDDSSTSDEDESKQSVEAAWDINGDWLQRNDIDLVQKAVEHFRHQRISMVQSLRQFVLCYESVLEWLVREAKNGNDIS